MKKRKFNLLLEIATLCLCVAAIAFGVYSAKNASLNVTGTVGFTAHNCDVYVAGKITGGIDADLKSITKYVSDVENATEDTFKSIGESYNWNIGTMYFDDINTTGDEIAKPITITLKIYNKSAFDVSFTFNENFLPREHLNVVVDNSTIEMVANETETDAHELNVTITLKDEDFTEEVISDDSVIGDFAKYVSPYYIKEITEEIYITENNAYEKVTTQKLCMTMGHSIVGVIATEKGTDGKTKTPLVWYAFAVKGNLKDGTTNVYSEKPTDIFNTATTEITTPITTKCTYTNSNKETITETWYSLYGVDMSKVSNYKKHTYWFIQQYVVAGGYKIGDNDEHYQKSISFNTESSGHYNNTYAQIDNYKKSNIYNYLNSEGDYINKGYVEKTGIKNEELNEIEKRSVNEEYVVSFTGSNAVSGKLNCQFESKYWLLNYQELGLLCNRKMEQNDSGGAFKTYGINNQDGDSNGRGASWWLRYPDKSLDNFVYLVNFGGALLSTYVDLTTYSVGVRAACQIRI